MVYRHLVKGSSFVLAFFLFFFFLIERRDEKKDVLFLHQRSHTSIGLLRTFEEFIPCEAQQDLCIDCVLAHERLVIDQGLRRSLVDAYRGPVEYRVRARTSGRAGHVQEI